MPDSIAEALADDPDGLLDEDAVEIAAVPDVEFPDPDEKEAWERLLRTLDASAWNEAIEAARIANGEDWNLDLSGTRFYEFTFNDRDLRGVDFTEAQLEYCSFGYTDLTDTRWDASSYVYGCSFAYAKLAGANLRNAGGIEQANGLERAYDYVPPLQDVTIEVARHYLDEAIADPTSFIHDGLEELRADGFRLFWDDGKLKFYLNYEMQRYRDLCKEGVCECPVEHACEGECTCCACYSGRCDCSKDHEEAENEPTEEYYLASIVGHIDFQWNSALGFIGNIVMDRRSQHPHVSTSGNICWGDCEMPRSIKPIDYFVAMLGWVGQHNPSDPYRDITTDLPRLR